MDTASGHIGKQPGEAGRAAAAVPGFAKGPVIAVALLLAVLLIAFSGRYATIATSCISWPADATWRGVTLINRRWCR
jgi:hypothetical protein